MKYDGVLKAILDSLEAGIVHQSLRKPIEDALVEKDNLKKIERVFVILVEVGIQQNLQHWVIAQKPDLMFPRFRNCLEIIKNFMINLIEWYLHWLKIL